MAQPNIVNFDGVRGWLLLEGYRNLGIKTGKVVLFDDVKYSELNVFHSNGPAHATDSTGTPYTKDIGDVALALLKQKDVVAFGLGSLQLHTILQNSGRFEYNEKGIPTRYTTNEGRGYIVF